ncbi:MAG: hypothetical protein LQ350_003421 [Teloschistes chrysophthalmus]|nr:MAG: hypothetical protein LQ350_003421 [Niorma chrysophthalma]
MSNDVDYLILIKIEGVDDPKAATYVERRSIVVHSVAHWRSSFYLGKKIAFVYRAHKEIRGTKIRVIWGKVTRPHGTPLQHERCWRTFADDLEQVIRVWYEPNFDATCPQNHLAHRSE